MDGLYMLEIFSVILIISFYATSFMFLLKKEAIQGRVVQYAYFHLYDRYVNKAITMKDKLQSWSRKVYRYFISDTYVIVEKPDIHAIDIGEEFPRDAVLVLEDNPVISVVEKGNRFQQIKPKKDPWVFVNHPHSAPTRPSLLENYEQYKLLARDDNWHEMIKNAHLK